ncbi:hypothetical protein COL922a_013948, partial [Colletotrichum nupharicola]
MEPFTAIGLIGNIITFIDAGCKLVSKANETYRSATGATAEHEALGETGARFLAAASSIEKSLVAANLRPDEVALKDLAVKCCGVSNELEQLLLKLKAKNAKSKRSAMSATLRNLWKDKEKAELEKKLISYRSELMLLLATTDRFDFQERLDELVQYGQSTQPEMVSLQDNIKALQTAVQAGVIGPDARQQLENFITAVGNASKKVRETTVLQALRSDMANER